MEEEEEVVEAEESVEEEPPEEAKVYVDNLPYDIDSERLAQLFEQAGVVEVSEVSTPQHFLSLRNSEINCDTASSTTFWWCTKHAI